MEKIKKLRQIFKTYNIDGYIIPKNDNFFGEYISDYNDRLNYISNFSGSYGFALILQKENYLFVDGRYTLQANIQSGKFFKIFTLPQKIPNKILYSKSLTIGFDPKILTKQTIKNFFKNNKCKLKPLKDNLIDYIWIRKFKKKINKFYIMPNSSIGKNYKQKINDTISILKKKRADFIFITSCENSAWLLNIRGGDCKYSPIPHCYILINKDKKINVFCDLKKTSISFKRYFKEIKFFDLSLIVNFLSQIKNKKFIIDKNTCSFYFEKIISQKNKIISTEDPIYNLKAIKNSKEINNIKTAHIYDGAAVTKYLFWLKNNYKKKKITEISGSQKLYEFRKKFGKFKFSSFPTISGSGPNGAIIHYKATNKTNRVIKKGDIYLVDSGGQYEFGTTDVTRTISLNNNNRRVKKIFTRVLKGHIGVANYKLTGNTNGSEIDIIARKYLKEINLDFAHGTGHGVGYFLNVHEGPQAISKNNKINLKEGMIVSNEPGYYETNHFGIRIENLIYIKKFGKKIRFENLTMVPIDKSLIDISILKNNEIIWINNYHSRVFKKLEKFMSKKERYELKEACSPI